MNSTIRRFFQGTPVLREFYGMARRQYHRRRIVRAAKHYFVNLADYRDALEIEDGKAVEIRTKDGLVLDIRRNYMDAAILAEIFVDHCYVQGLSLPERPVVVDIGGYIGDFALYAAKHLKARKVVVCEPSPRNWVLLQKNVAQNHFQDQIVLVNKAVTNGEDVMMDVDACDGAQARVSTYGTKRAEPTLIPGVALATLAAEHGLNTIDLLKIDCEGGEYDILQNVPESLLKNVRNIVFEFHEIEGFRQRLEAVYERLRQQGFSLVTRGCLVSASRA